MNLAMFRRQFAIENGEGCPALQESWRRTWWQIYIVDCFYAAIQRNISFPTRDITATVDLPCEESEYESGVSARMSGCGSVGRILRHPRLSRLPKLSKNTTLESSQLTTTPTHLSRI